LEYIEERLDRDKHFRMVGDFRCGPDDPLNVFLSDDSFDYDEERYGLTYLLREKDSGIILAFYTIKSNGVQTYSSECEEYNAVPVVEIARIAVEFELQHTGVGRRLFYEYILPKIRKVESLIAVRAIIVFVDPDNEAGIGFYKSLGFEKATEDVQQKINESFNEKCDLYVLDLRNKEEILCKN